MDALDELKQMAREGQRESRIMSKAYSSTLSALVPANILLVVGAALFSLVAGASILIKQEFLSETRAGLLALASAALTVLHTKLHCEKYQAESKRLSMLYRGIALDYGNLQIISDPDELRKSLSELNKQASAVTKNATAEPFGWALKKAKKSTPRSQP